MIRRLCLSFALAAALIVPMETQAQFYLGQTFSTPAANSYLASVFTGDLNFANPGPLTSWNLFEYSPGSLGALIWSQAINGPFGPNQTVAVGELLNPLATYAFVGFASQAQVFAPSDAFAGEAILCGAITQPCTASFGAGRDINNFSVNLTSVSVPEPGTYLLILSGLLGMGFLAWRREDGRVEV